MFFMFLVVVFATHNIWQPSTVVQYFNNLQVGQINTLILRNKPKMKLIECAKVGGLMKEQKMYIFK